MGALQEHEEPRTDNEVHEKKRDRSVFCRF